MPQRRAGPGGDHPRLRGEHFDNLTLGQLEDGSSPPTRGAHDVALDRSGASGIIPAYAGSTTGATTHAAAPADHPRLRGEHTPIADTRSAGQGSSPPTRGARVHRGRG